METLKQDVVYKNSGFVESNFLSVLTDLYAFIFS